MAVAELVKAEPVDVPGITRPMTYEEYLAGPEEMARYDILDGWKVYRLYGDNLLPGPNRRHQNIALNIAEGFRHFQRTSRQGEVIIAPCDVQITYQPLRSRQPDLLFISQGRLEQNGPPDEYAPLSPAPELVVEVISPSDTPSVLASKIADYEAVSVQEIWLVRPGPQTVEVLRISSDGAETLGLYGMEQVARSEVFPGLTVAVSDAFEEE